MSHRGGYDRDRDRYYYGGGGGSSHSRGREPSRRDDGGYNQQHQHHRPSDRSRSRDDRSRGGGGGGYGRDGRDGYGRGGGGGYGRGGGGGRPGGPKPEQSLLRTNFFPLKARGTWFQYRVERIVDGMTRWAEHNGQRRMETDSNGHPVIVPRRRMGQIRELDLARMEKTENPLPVRIIKQLMMEERERLGEENFVLSYDMGESIYSPRRLFDPAEQRAAREYFEAQRNAAMAAPELAEDDEEVEGAPPPPPPPPQIDEDAPYARNVPGIYHIRVRKDCDPDDPDAERVPFNWYILSLQEVAVRDLNVLNGRPVIARGENQALSQVVNTMLRSAFAFAGFPTISAYSFIKNPQDVLRLIQSRELRNMLNQGGDVFPSIGVLQLLKFCMTGDGRHHQPYVQRDAKIGFLDQPNIRILREDRGRHSIAGVDIRNPHQNVADLRLREQIQEALQKKKFDIRYTTNDPTHEQKLRAEGMSHAEIVARRTVVRGKNLTLRLYKPDSQQEGIYMIWDPSTYTFPVGNGDDARNVTVQQYYLERYGIRLNFPRMPLIHTKIRGRSNWIPIEFLWQSFGKAKDANGPENVRAILAEKDSAAGPQLMNQLQKVFGREIPEVNAYLQSCNIQIDKEPLTLQARVLPNPRISFLRGGATINNGSWDTRNAKFSNPADFSSFGVLDFTNGGAREFLKNQFRVCEQYGMTLPDSASECAGEMTREICQNGGRSMTPESISNDFSQAVYKARDFFVHDTRGRFRNTNTWFRSWCILGAEQSSQCLILPHHSPKKDPSADHVVEDQEVGLILPPNIEPRTHEVYVGSAFCPARVMVRVKFVNRQQMVVDPFDVRSWNGRYQAKQNNVWVNADFDELLYQLVDDNLRPFQEPLPARKVSVHRPYVRVPANSVEGPAAVFVYLPEQDKDSYNSFKMVASFEHGVTSQVAIKRNYEKQRNKDQFCAAIALKLNGKLSNKWNDGRAWTVDANNNGTGLVWYSEGPRAQPNQWIRTMLMGLSMARGQGQGALTVVAATACMDKFAMQTCSTIKIQDENSMALEDRNTSVIASAVLTEIVSEMATQFRIYNRGYPQRLLVYRDGLSDGNFPAATSEIDAIRQAFHNLRSSEASFQCRNAEACKGKGCKFCTPTITFISCQNDHGIKLVPKDDNQGVRGRGHRAPTNVHSGTVVDHTIVEGMQNLAVANDNEGSSSGASPDLPLFTRIETSTYDFLLTPQGGLKGTSKPVYYRVLLNENDIFDFAGGSRLGRDSLETLTYQLSFLYSTATKSTRSVPVVHYSSSLANQAMGWIGHLIHIGKVTCERNGDGETEFLRVDSAGNQSKQLLPGFAPFDPNDPHNTRPAFRPCGLICAKAKKG